MEATHQVPSGEGAGDVWHALTLMKRLHDGQDVRGELHALGTSAADADTTCVLAVASVMASGDPTSRAAHAQLAAALQDAHAGQAQDASVALVQAATTLTFDASDVGAAVATYAAARSLLPAEPPGSALEASLTHVTLNVLSVFCSRTGLLDAAFELTEQSLLLEPVIPAHLDGGTARLNLACMTVEDALLPRISYAPVDLERLRSARAQFETLVDDPRMVGSRGDAVQTGLAVWEAWEGDPDRAWELLPRTVRGWSSPFGPPGFWVAAAARCVRRSLEAGTALSARRDRLAEVRAAYAALLTRSVVAANLTAVVCTEMLELERIVAPLGDDPADAVRAHAVLTDRDQVLSRLLVVARSALEAAAAGHTRSTYLTRANRALWHENSVDALTGVGTRRHLERALDNLDGNLLVAVVIADLDEFKTVNDTHGHVVGDQVLARVGELLEHAVREGDLVFRYGGDEFVILLPGADDAAADRCARRCEQVVADHDWTRLAPQLTVTLTAGAHAATGDARGTIERADDWLRLRKGARRR